VPFVRPDHRGYKQKRLAYGYDIAVFSRIKRPIKIRDERELKLVQSFQDIVFSPRIVTRHLFALDCVFHSIITPDAQFGVCCPFHTCTRRKALEIEIGERGGRLDDLNERFFCK